MFSFITVALVIVSLHSNKTLTKTTTERREGLQAQKLGDLNAYWYLIDMGPAEENSRR